MKREIKFKLYLQHEETGIKTSKVFNYACIFSGAAKMALQTAFPRYFIIGKSEYTGLKDKNGKEIYDGDVVSLKDFDYEIADSYGDETDSRWNNYPNDLPLKEYNKDVVTMDRFPRFWLLNEAFGWEGDELQDPAKYEIIGNIYENPELLH